MATAAAGMRLASGAGGLASSASSSSGSRAALAAPPPQRRQQQRRQALLVVAPGGQRRGSGAGGRKAVAPVADTDGDGESAADLADERIESVTSATALSEDQQAQLDALAEAISAKLGALADSDDWTPGKRHACAFSLLLPPCRCACSVCTARRYACCTRLQTVILPCGLVYYCLQIRCCRMLSWADSWSLDQTPTLCWQPSGACVTRRGRPLLPAQQAQRTQRERRQLRLARARRAGGGAGLPAAGSSKSRKNCCPRLPSSGAPTSASQVSRRTTCAQCPRCLQQQWGVMPKPCCKLVQLRSIACCCQLPVAVPSTRPASPPPLRPPNCLRACSAVQPNCRLSCGHCVRLPGSDS
jgi:hypothetical protein